MSTRVTVVIPCYNEENRLAIDRFRDFTLPGRALELLFVNDGSRDGTLAMLQALAAEAPDRVRVLDVQPNGGKAEAVRRGILDALERGAEQVGFWDADLATPLEELPGFCDVLDGRGDIHMVFGARVKLLGRAVERDIVRHYLGRFAATLISWALGIGVYDTQCGAKLFRASDALRRAMAEPFTSRWIFDVEIIARYIGSWGRDAAARAIYELPLHRWNDVGGSKVRSTDFLRALRDLRNIKTRYRL